MRLSALLVLLLAMSCGGVEPAGETLPSEESVPRFNMSLEDLMAQEQLAGAPAERWQAALSPYVGHEVRWRLLSWGGEGTSGRFETPPGGPRGSERVRLVSLTLGLQATLGEVMDQGHPVVACLARDLDSDRGAFVHDTAERYSAVPGTYQPVILSGQIWGVIGDGRSPTLWLRDCEVVADQEP